MAAITAAMVKELREATGAGMMECKKALTEADGDFDAAVDVLRTRGLAAAAKKAGRATNEGRVNALVEGKKGAVVQVNCETDFVALTDKFGGYVDTFTKAVIENDPADPAALLESEYEGEKVQDALTEAIHVIGENMKVMRFQRVAVENGAMTGYIHLGGKLADIVVCEFSKPETGATDEFKTFAHDVAMHIAATAPVATTREDVPAATVEHEMSIYKAQAAESGKPEAIQERMAQGRLEKYFKEFVLCEQEFVKDSSVTIDGLAKKVSKSLGDDIKVKTFVLYRFGEEA